MKYKCRTRTLFQKNRVRDQSEFGSCPAAVAGLSVCTRGSGSRNGYGAELFVARLIAWNVRVLVASQPLVVVADRVSVRERVERKQRSRTRQQTLLRVVAGTRLMQTF